MANTPFAYTITISNDSDLPVQLLSRHWIITDADNEVQEVRGEGVVGEQPVIPPAGLFSLHQRRHAHHAGGLHGGQLLHGGARANGHRPATTYPLFEVPIRAFSLHTPTALN